MKICFFVNEILTINDYLLYFQEYLKRPLSYVLVLIIL
jgi:hypothetical protein